MQEIPIFLRVTIPLTQAYEDDEMKLCDVHGELVFRLFGNGGQAEAAAVVGIWKQTGARIVARLQVPYRMHIPTSTLELCGNDLEAEDAHSLFLCDTEGQEKVRLRPYETQCNDLRGKQFMPLRETLRGVWGHIKSACMENGVAIKTRNPPPKALEGLYAVHEFGVLRNIYDPKRDEFDPEKIMGSHLTPCTSIVTGVTTFLPLGTNIVNVIGSSGGMIGGVQYAPDRPKTPLLAPYATSWIQAWSLATAVPGGFCACAGVMHICTPGAYAFVGGHILQGVIGAVVQNVMPLVGVALILPICKMVNNTPAGQFQTTLPMGVTAVNIASFLI